MEGPAKLGIAVAVFSLLLFGGIILVDRGKNATGEPLMGTFFESQGQAHIAVGAAHDPYNSNPPTSGPHYAEPADWGVYDRELPDEQLIHNLEHGHVWLSYRDPNDQEAIDMFSGYVEKTLKFRRITPRGFSWLQPRWVLPNPAPAADPAD